MVPIKVAARRIAAHGPAKITDVNSASINAC